MAQLAVVLPALCGQMERTYTSSTPRTPAPWGELPDQYGRRFDGDDGTAQFRHSPTRRSRFGAAAGLVGPARPHGGRSLDLLCFDSADRPGR